MLVVANLEKTFVSPSGERSRILSVAEFSLGAGEQLALRGESGTGKTTFLHLIAGILGADSGTITVSGEAVSDFSESRRDRWRARSLGYVHQAFNLLQGLTALENVRLAMSLGVGDDNAEATRLLQRVGLGERLHHRPAQLSAGQQQRVAVARAVANRPALVLADEPTAALDVRHRAEVITLLRETCRESAAALLLVSHDEMVLGEFDRVIDFRELNRALAEVDQ